jgi:hypothetical protein
MRVQTGLRKAGIASRKQAEAHCKLFFKQKWLTSAGLHEPCAMRHVGLAFDQNRWCQHQWLQQGGLPQQRQVLLLLLLLLMTLHTG